MLRQFCAATVNEANAISDVDEYDADELSDIESLDHSRFGHSATHTREQRSECDQRVSDRTIATVLNSCVTHRTVECRPDQENRRVGIDERCQQPDPLPSQRSTTWAEGLKQRLIDRRQQHKDRADHNERKRNSRQDVRRTTAEVKVNGTLSKWITTEDCAGNVPGFVQKNRISKQCDPGFKERPQAIGENADRPPHQVATTFCEIPAANIGKKIGGEKRRQDRQIMDRVKTAEHLIHESDSIEDKLKNANAVVVAMFALSDQEYLSLGKPMSVVHDFTPGDFLIFQLEAGYGLLRMLGTDEIDGEHVWHVAAYSDLFLDPEMADAAIEGNVLRIEIPHAALTNRAFESTQVARMGNRPLSAADLAGYEAWKTDGTRKVSDRSIRLLLGLR